MKSKMFKYFFKPYQYVGRSELFIFYDIIIITYKLINNLIITNAE